MEINKAIIPAAGLGTRFLPLSKASSKELLPLVDVPLVHYTVEEVRDSGVGEVIFVLSENKKEVAKYFKEDRKLKKILKENNRADKLSEILKNHKDKFKEVSFSSSIQKSPKGDGDAVLKAQKKVGKKPFAVLFPDDIFKARDPVIGQLGKVFRTSSKPVIGLKRVPKDKVSSYGAVAVEKIASKLYKIKKIKEKVPADKAPSDLVVAGRYILTPEIFGYLRKLEPNEKGEVILAEALNSMIEDGKIVYGAEIKGEWLECGKTEDWLKSFFYLSLKHPQYGSLLRDMIKKVK